MIIKRRQSMQEQAVEQVYLQVTVNVKLKHFHFFAHFLSNQIQRHPMNNRRSIFLLLARWILELLSENTKINVSTVAKEVRSWQVHRSMR